MFLLRLCVSLPQWKLSGAKSITPMTNHYLVFVLFIETLGTNLFICFLLNSEDP